MSKLCKSCGNYYDGDFCDKCGYGKKATASKAAAKYKKATKPQRFQTEEEKALYAKWEKEKQKEKNKKKQAKVKNKAKGKKHSKANVIILAAVAVFAGVLIFVALYQSGVIFSNTRTQLVEDYFQAVQNSDYEKFIKCFPKEIKKDYEADKEQSGLSDREYLDVLYGDFKETYGSDYTIEIEFGKETQLSSSEYDLSDYREQYGSVPNLSEVYEMVVNVKFKGSLDEEEAKLYIDVGKCSGKWRIFNISQDVGIVNDSTGAIVEQ